MWKYYILLHVIYIKSVLFSLCFDFIANRDARTVTVRYEYMYRDTPSLNVLFIVSNLLIRLVN